MVKAGLFLLSFLIISKEFVYISDEFIVILAFIIIIGLFFTQLSSVIASALDEYSLKISTTAKELIVLQQKTLQQSKEYQVDLLHMSLRIQLLSSYVLDEVSDIMEFCNQKYIDAVDNYIIGRLMTIVLLDLDYYENTYNKLLLEELDQIIVDGLIEYMHQESETLTDDLFFPFVDEDSE